MVLSGSTSVSASERWHRSVQVWIPADLSHLPAASHALLLRLYGGAFPCARMLYTEDTIVATLLRFLLHLRRDPCVGCLAAAVSARAQEKDGNQRDLD